MPPLRSRVNDLAGVLPPERAARLERELAAFEAETSHQIAVLTIDTLEGDALEDFSIRVVESWQLGQRGVDNGALVLVVPGDRVMRIEVGYGLEGVVPDAIASRIVNERMLPSFREGSGADGIEAGVAALMAAARGEEIPVERRPRRARGSGRAPSPVPMVILMGALLGAFCGVPFQSAGRRRLRPLGALLGGGIAGAVAFVLLHSLVWAGFAFLLGGFGGYQGTALGSALGARRPGLRRGFGVGGFGSGGGFSGGGGGFGGGGASGSW